jgi:hypothetical protein
MRSVLDAWMNEFLMLVKRRFGEIWDMGTMHEMMKMDFLNVEYISVDIKMD